MTRPKRKARKIDRNDPKNYYCKECDKAFSCVEYLQNHKRNVHKIKPHFCGPCDRSFMTAKELHRHLKIIHEGIKDYK